MVGNRMNVERVEIGLVSVLRLEGDLDERGVERLRDVLGTCLAGGCAKLVLNFRDVRYVSYMGVGVVVERLRRARALRGDIKLVGVNLYTERLLRMAGVGSLFDTHDTEAQAVALFQEVA